MKYHINFVAKESITGGIEMDIEDGLLEAQMEDAAIAEVEFAYPELMDVEIVKIEAVTV